ncbi:FAD-binding oxidoreductase (plasmid) [Paracoccus sp. Arc7-R13]|uniref:NAD(P)/FAD-dependent oxidoreductase n=1 Tax=Paracoccus sp. Arc7-R13 TaxID=2500532 RepID=UPI000FDAFD48|nr:FAD-dependent oxidoreductase [Paracoccus sp. Arc7-R13]AZY95522.1 FAD-binding oxidoreductase [Paracoccus sp. Arc7-R13]
MTHVGVIGAGAIGLACAFYLRRAGCRVTIVDESGPVSGASYGNAGTFAPYASIPVNHPSVFANIPSYLLSRDSPFRLRTSYLPRMLPWLAAFLHHSTTVNSRASSAALSTLLGQAQAGWDPILNDLGRELIDEQECLYLYGTETAFAAARPDLDLRDQLGSAFDLLGPSEVRALEPALAPRFARGVLFRGSWRFRSPHRLLLQLAEMLVRNDVQIVRDNARRIEPQDVSAILHFEAGAPMAFDRVIVAAGAKSRSLAASCGDVIPLDTERGYHVAFQAGESLLSRPCGWAERGIYMTPMEGELRAAGTVELGGFSLKRNTGLLRHIGRSAREALPDLSGPSSEWMGFRPTLPDGLPVLDFSRHSIRVIYAFGHQHVGLTLAGTTGEIVACLATGQATPTDITPFSCKRFKGQGFSSR